MRSGFHGATPSYAPPVYGDAYGLSLWDTAVSWWRGGPQLPADPNAQAAVAQQQRAQIQAALLAYQGPPKPSPVPWIVAGATVVALGAGVYVAQRRRRKR